jgi:flavin reductase (DIM6/NTAB) family NADH-FMN oxidoreductase RutF
LNSLSEDLREAMRQWTSGVSIVCSHFMDQIHGMTVNSFTSVSLNPPVIIVTLANNTRTCHIVNESGLFSVSILKDTQKFHADKFSGKVNEEGGRFNGIETITLPGGATAIQGALAVLECKVREKITLDESTLYLSDVTYTSVDTTGRPLVYHNREYHTL